MVVGKYVGRCLDVGSTPTGSIFGFQTFPNLSETLIYQRFFILYFLNLPEPFRKRELQKELQKGGATS